MFGHWGKRLKHALKGKAVILMYHQVCERLSDPWELAVTPEAFDEQVTFLKKNFDVVPLDEIADGVLSRNLSGKKIAITFDDGFSDNFSNAKPILESHSLPATFYIATHGLNSTLRYWWDELETIILHSEQLPRELHTKVGGEAVSFTFRADSVLDERLRKEILNWRAELPASNERLTLFMNLWMKIKPLPFGEQQEFITELREWAGTGAATSEDGRVMTYTELRAMFENPLFSIGAHTVHHSMLAAHDDQVQAFEVRESKRIIEDFLQGQVDAFAYPYGNYNNTTKKILEQAGFSHAVSTESRFVSGDDDIFALPRMQVKNWSALEFSSNIKKLLSYEAGR
jgi:peptidoglycan/xylan/chitin deacetylase (PgdA/CDA1 family)